MTTFTNSPFERMMQEKPRYSPEPQDTGLPADHPCSHCSYEANCCRTACYRKLLKRPAEGGDPQ